MLMLLPCVGVASSPPDINEFLQAAERGDVAQLRTLLERGADVNAGQPGSGITALMGAAAGGHLEAVRLLLEEGADVNAHSGEVGSTALMEAIESGHLEVVKVLLNGGADVNAKEEYGATALKIARAKRRTEIAAYLKAHGAR